MRKQTSLLLIGFVLALFCQLKATSQTIPVFQMQLSNGMIFSVKDLQPGKPLVLIYFAPDCEHCQVLMDSFFKNIKEFKNTEVVLVTFKPLSELYAFERKYKTINYPNIKVGTEGTRYYLRNYYRLQNTPFTALYDKNGKFVYSYKKETPVSDLISRLKQLK